MLTSPGISQLVEQSMTSTGLSSSNHLGLWSSYYVPPSNFVAGMESRLMSSWFLAGLQGELFQSLAASFTFLMICQTAKLESLTLWGMKLIMHTSV